jgi:hypothetical protein
MRRFLTFTIEHCTSNVVRSDIEKRFGGDLEVPHSVPAPPNVAEMLRELEAGIRTIIERAAVPSQLPETPFYRRPDVIISSILAALSVIVAVYFGFVAHRDAAVPGPAVHATP